MIKIEINARPKIRDKQFLLKLYDEGIFNKQLDVWAYALAFALKNDLRSESDNLRSKWEEMTELDHMDKTTLDALILAAEAYLPELTNKEAAGVINELSQLASAGLAVIRKETEGRRKNEIYEFLLNQA